MAATEYREFKTNPKIEYRRYVSFVESSCQALINVVNDPDLDPVACEYRMYLSAAGLLLVVQSKGTLVSWFLICFLSPCVLSFWVVVKEIIQTAFDNGINFIDTAEGNVI